MMTKEDYELRLAVAREMREQAAHISPVAVELAESAVVALNEQWKRAQIQASAEQAAEYVASLAKDSQRLQWVIENRAVPEWNAKANGVLTPYVMRGPLGYFGDPAPSARDAIDSAMLTYDGKVNCTYKPKRN